MTQLSVYQLINIGLIIINAIVIFLPKQVTGMQGNAAGAVILIAIVVFAVLFIHLILTVIALLGDKLNLLKVMTYIMVPVSVIFWLYMVPMIRF